MTGYQAQNVDAIRAERIVCTIRAGELNVKAFQVVFHKDGSFFISFPYFRHRTGLLSASSIAASGSRESQVNLERGGKVTSHLVKYSHHVDGPSSFFTGRQDFHFDSAAVDRARSTAWTHFLNLHSRIDGA